MSRGKRQLSSESFAAAQATAAQGFFAGLWDFVTHNKKWWLAPLLVVFLLLSALIALGGSAAAPFVYTLF